MIQLLQGRLFYPCDCAHALCATDKTSVSEAIRPRGRGAQKLNRVGNLDAKTTQKWMRYLK